MNPPSAKLENMLYKKGFVHVAGVDEAGRGPLAGPVVGAAVILPSDAKIAGLDDSKKLSPAKRWRAFEQIREQALSLGVGIADVNLINQINIFWASLFAMREAVLSLKPQPDFVLVDGQAKIACDILQEAVVGGDGKVAVIAAASVVAKVVRDKIMLDYHKEYPAYGFAAHKGYGTAAHIAALKRWGPSPIHRNFWQTVMQEKLFKSL
jgi:ribonuclease HII